MRLDCTLPAIHYVLAKMGLEHIKKDTPRQLLNKIVTDISAAGAPGLGGGGRRGLTPPN